MSNKVITVTIPRAVVTSVYTSEKNGSQFISMSSPAGEFKFSCTQGVHDFNAYLEADRMDFAFEISGRLFNNQQALQIQKVINTGAKATNSRGTENYPSNQQQVSLRNLEKFKEHFY